MHLQILIRYTFQTVTNEGCRMSKIQLRENDLRMCMISFRMNNDQGKSDQLVEAVNREKQVANWWFGLLWMEVEEDQCQHRAMLRMKLLISRSSRGR